MIKDHRWPKFSGEQDFTGDQTSLVTKYHRWASRVTKLHRWPNHRWPNFTGDQSRPVTKHHWCPKLHQWQIVHRWTSLPPQYGTDVPHCRMEAEPLALLWNKYYFDQGRPKALPNFCQWTLKLSPNMDETLSAGRGQKAGTPQSTGNVITHNKICIQTRL